MAHGDYGYLYRYADLGIWPGTSSELPAWDFYNPIDEPTGGHIPYTRSRVTRRKLTLVPKQRLQDAEHALAIAEARIEALEAALAEAL